MGQCSKESGGWGRASLGQVFGRMDIQFVLVNCIADLRQQSQIWYEKHATIGGFGDMN